MAAMIKRHETTSKRSIPYMSKEQREKLQRRRERKGRLDAAAEAAASAANASPLVFATPRGVAQSLGAAFFTPPEQLQLSEEEVRRERMLKRRREAEWKAEQAARASAAAAKERADREERKRIAEALAQKEARARRAREFSRPGPPRITSPAGWAELPSSTSQSAPLAPQQKQMVFEVKRGPPTE